MANEVARPGEKPIGRRLFLGLSGLGTASLLFGHALGGGQSSQSSSGVSSFFGELAGQGGFRIYTVAPVPKFDPATWRLTVNGLVEKPIELTFAQLQALPDKVEKTIFHCVTGWSVPNLTWHGISLKTILEAVQPKSGAKALTFYSSDGAYTDSLTLDQAQVHDVMLAYQMNGKPLPLDQG
ncbi:MAG: molybdopterin-dependent oxidoreductase, partial [Chloroflexota bacterium]